jgi:hypothetical protein
MRTSADPLMTGCTVPRRRARLPLCIERHRRHQKFPLAPWRLCTGQPVTLYAADGADVWCPRTQVKPRCAGPSAHPLGHTFSTRARQASPGPLFRKCRRALPWSARRRSNSLCHIHPRCGPRHTGRRRGTMMLPLRARQCSRRGRQRRAGGRLVSNRGAPRCDIACTAWSSPSP